MFWEKEKQKKKRVVYRKKRMGTLLQNYKTIRETKITKKIRKIHNNSNNLLLQK